MASSCGCFRGKNTRTGGVLGVDGRHGVILTERRFFAIITKMNEIVKNIWEELPKGFTALAPMEGVTDVIFRQVIARAGRPDLFFTEFTNVSSYASERGRDNALERLEVVATDKPIIAQIWGKNPEHFAETAEVLEELGFVGLDINMGCPDRHVNAAGGGAAMIRTPELAVECIRQAKKATRLPVSVKTRLGYSFVEEFREWLPVVLREKPAALTVHLRTRKEMSKVSAHYELIPEIAKLRDEFSPETKLVINGDIKDLRQCQELSGKYPEVDGWMIGRGVFENPYCFTDHESTKDELMELLNYHLDLFDAKDAEYCARQAERMREDPDFALKMDGKVRSLPFEPLKRFFKIYLRDFPGANDLRAKLMEAHSTSEVREILAEFTEKTSKVN